MPHVLVLSFRNDVSLIEASEGRVALESPGGRVTLNRVSSGLLKALRALTSGGATEDQLSERVLETDGTDALARLYCQLRRFRSFGMLCYRLVIDGRPFATVVPMARDFGPSARSVGPDGRWRLSRFAYCRRDEDALVLESPLSTARTILHGSGAAALLAELTQPRTCRDLCACDGSLAEATAQAVMSLLASAGTIEEVGKDGGLPEDKNATLRQWEFHDLLFHSRSRLGRHDYPVGGTFRFLADVPPLPAVKPAAPGGAVPLYRPDLDQIEREDPPFTRVLESRKSVRVYGQPITVQQLGEFLYRVGRVRSIHDPDSARGLHYQSSSRPYPSGGATYDLELYVSASACAGLGSGLYHYNPLDHNLRKLADRTVAVGMMMRDARFAAALACEPQLLITIASRFQRLSWKYSSIAYATTLKNVGVLYQTMYLVATAMGLAPCALGAGNSARFAEAAGTNYFAESSVGEFLLGSLPSDSETATTG